MVVATSPQAFARRASWRPGTPIEQKMDAFMDAQILGKKGNYLQ